nr:hypothetical protein GCM10020092_004840 [Actinoplanes digitatis]
MNTQAIDLTLVPDGPDLAFAVTGTDYRAPVRDASFAATRPFWNQTVVSETPSVYRGEHLAAALLADDPAGVAAAAAGGTLIDVVRRAAEARYDEGYERGVHDADAALILEALVRLSAASRPAALSRPGTRRGAAVLGLRRGRQAGLGAPRVVAGPGPGDVRLGQLRAARAVRGAQRGGGSGSAGRRVPGGGAGEHAGRVRHRQPAPARSSSASTAHSAAGRRRPPATTRTTCAPWPVTSGRGGSS